MEPNEPDQTDHSEEFLLRVEEVRRLIAQGKRNGEIKRICAANWGISPRSVEPYIGKARELLRSDIGLSRRDLQYEMVAKLEALIANPDTKPLTAIRAMENIAKILGLYQPMGLQITPPDGERKERQEDPCNKLLSNPNFVAFELMKAAEEDKGESDGSSNGDLPESSDPGIVWEDSDEGDEESSAVA